MSDTAFDDQYRAHLFGGPFDGANQPLLAPRWLERPPDLIVVAECPCCGRTAAMVAFDRRAVTLAAHGTTLWTYRKRMEQPPSYVEYELDADETGTPSRVLVEMASA